MTDRSTAGSGDPAGRKPAAAAWSTLTLYEKFEQVVVFILTAVIAVVVIVAVWNLARTVTVSLALGALDPLDHASFQQVFGMIFTVVIAMEFKRSLLVVAERRFGVTQVRSIVLIAILAIVRKFIILDPANTEPALIAALAASILALGLVYWLVRDQDRKEDSDLRAGLRPGQESGAQP